MADNTILNLGSGGDTIATDDIGPGVKYQRVKVTLGADGVNDGDVASGNPMPVGGNVAHDAADAGNPTKIGGKATTSLPTAVGNGDRVDASFDLQGQQRITGTVQVNGTITHDAPDGGQPVKIGAVAESTESAAVADGDRTNLIADLNGKLVVSPYAVKERFTSGVTAAITGTANTAVIAAPGASLSLHITHILVTNSHATVGTVVEIKDGTTVLYRGYAREDGGGFSVTLPVPLRLTANTALNAANVTTGSNTYVSASGYIAP